MSELPDWIYEGAAVYSLRVSGNWGGTPDPIPVEVLRFTPTRIVVRDRGSESAYSKKDLRGIGSVGDYKLVPDDDPHVITSLRKAAVKKSMEKLRAVFDEMSYGNKINWNELPNALEAAERFHDASFEAIKGMEEARDRYGEGERRVGR
jgi:hypothetical protein